MINTLKKIIFFLIFVGIGLAIMFNFLNKPTEFYKNIKYKGLVLFDIDGTLSVKTKENNHEVVKYCLDNGYAVGISTAGSLYNMDNLLQFNWMPENLYNFMIFNNNITFNNVRSGYVTGKYEPDSYSKIYNNSDLDMIEKFGFAKGFTMDRTANMLNIQDTKKMILCDDMKGFINGYVKYNKNYQYIFCGDSEGLTKHKIIKHLNNNF
jgi:hydroxymethylpyrimidine pyrophosphatase-like HAD family hydrolase|tara:strand:+ start:523 stop:1146 length:624 start_codon:yes stop_codon:yes gene_type:complete